MLILSQVNGGMKEARGTFAHEYTMSAIWCRPILLHILLWTDNIAQLESVKGQF